MVSKLAAFSSLYNKINNIAAFLLMTHQGESRVIDTLPDVPGFVFDVLQTQHLRDLDWRQSVPQVCLVGEEEYRDLFVADI